MGTVIHHPVIRYHVLPLVGKIHLPFYKGSFKHIADLQSRMVDYTRVRNIQKLKEHLALCIQEFDSLDATPIGMDVIKGAVKVVEEYYHFRNN